MSVQAARIARERDRAEREAAKAGAVNDFMASTLLSPDPVDGFGADATILEVLDAAVANLQGDFSEDPEVDATIRSSIGWAYYKLTRYDEAQPLLEEALRIREEQSGGESVEVAESLHQVAALLQVLAETDSAEALFRSALDMRKRTLGPDDHRIAESLVQLSGLLVERGRYEEGEEGLVEAVEILERGGGDPLQIAWARNRLGQLHWLQGDLEGAEPHFRSALSQRRKELESDHPLVGESLNNLAVLLDDLGRTDEAETLYREALVAIEKAYGESSDFASGILGNLAQILSGKGDGVGADSLFRRALAIDQDAFGPDHPTVAFDEINYAAHLCEVGRAGEGVVLASDAVRIVGDALDPGQWEVGAARAARGRCLKALGRFAEGEQELLEALRVTESALGSTHSRVDGIRVSLADLYDAWEKPAEAARYREAAQGGGAGAPG
jgi:tetratricopeptide (TPR) repeat protein